MLEKMFRGSDNQLTANYFSSMQAEHPSEFPTITPIQRNECQLGSTMGFELPTSNHSSKGCHNPPTSFPNISSPSKRHCAWNIGMYAETFDLIKEEGNYLLADDLVNDLVDIYLADIHVWIPILHPNSFKAQIGNFDERQRVAIILHAIVALCVRFSCDPRVGDPELRSQCSRWNRQIVVLKSTESCTIESLQASVIITFDNVSHLPVSFTISDKVLTLKGYERETTTMVCWLRSYENCYRSWAEHRR